MNKGNLDLDKIEEISHRFDEFNHLLKCFPAILMNLMLIRFMPLLVVFQE